MAMEPLKPEVMVRQVEGLAGDLRALTDPFDQQIRTLLTPLEWRSVKKVYLTGDGDSYHASCAAEMAFEAIADVTCEPMNAQRFLDYGAAWMRPGSATALTRSISCPAPMRGCPETISTSFPRTPIIG